MNFDCKMRNVNAQVNLYAGFYSKSLNSIEYYKRHA